MSLTYRERKKRLQIARATLLQAECFASGDKYAEWLRLEGIRGKRGNPCECPIANLLKRETGSTTPSVDNARARIYRHEYPISLGAIAAEFVQMFDAGRYPWLVKR